MSNSYHGETLGALAVGDVALYKETYRPLLMEAITVPSPDCFHRDADDSWAAHPRACSNTCSATWTPTPMRCARSSSNPWCSAPATCACTIPVYLKLLRAACDKYGVHLIADEIAVGFGRTGTLFACEQAGITPDFLCLSKGLTGGYLPLAAVLTGDEIYRAFYDDYHKLTAFLHSHSYTGNPLGCRAALATLDIFARTISSNAIRYWPRHDDGKRRFRRPSSCRGSPPDRDDRRR